MTSSLATLSVRTSARRNAGGSRLAVNRESRGWAKPGAKPLFLLYAAAMLIAGTSCAAPPSLKASVEEPVLQELLGGCSLRCAFPWTVESQPAGGRKAQPVATLNDESAETAWLNPAPEKGGFGKLRLAFPKKIPAEMEGEVPLYGLDLINGHWKSEALWAQHGRVKKARIFYNNKPLRDVLFADSRRWQRVPLPDIMLRSGDALTLEILEIYPGTKPGVAISEIVLQGAH